MADLVEKAHGGGEEAMHDDLFSAVRVFANESELRGYLSSEVAHLPEVQEGEQRRIEVFRTPGSFLYEFASSQLEWDEIVSFFATNPDVLFACMDERVCFIDGGAVCSHDGCGAAKLVFGWLQSKPELREKFDGVIDATKLETVLNSGQPDLLGRLWATAVSEAARASNPQVKTNHLAINSVPHDTHQRHYTSTAILDATGVFGVRTDGEPGARPFVISSTESVGIGSQGKKSSKERAYRMLLDLGNLAAVIARGDHSLLYKHKEAVFWLPVIVDDNFDRALFEEILSEFQEGLDEKNAKIVIVPEPEIHSR